MPLSYFICVSVTAASALVSLGFSIAGLRAADGSARTASMYAAARSIALAVVAVIAFFIGSIAFVTAVAIAMVIVQAMDAGTGIVIKDRMKTVGPTITALVNLAALVWLLA